MNKKSNSKGLSLATTSILGQSPSPDFSDAELELMHRWEAPEVGARNARTNNQIKIQQRSGRDKQTEKPKILTVDEIETMQDQAYLESFQKGEKKGYEVGYEKGHMEGSKKGYDENLELLNQQAELLKKLMESLSEPFKQLDEQVEQELVKLAMGVATQIIRREIKTDPGQIIGAVREAISALPVSSRKITLHLHPEDASLVRSALALDEMSPAWELIEEPLITRGGCKVDTETSRIDATIENRLAQIIANVLGDQREQDQAE
jgi:flagellar assembly protein FliH